MGADLEGRSGRHIVLIPDLKSFHGKGQDETPQIGDGTVGRKGFRSVPANVALSLYYGRFCTCS